MQKIVILCLCCLNLFSNQAGAQQTNFDMPQFIKTSIGDIAYFERIVAGTTPIIFLHGVYYDHHLWNYQTSRITDQTVISIDMPLHGKSKDITKQNWTLDDCATMLIEILDTLAIETCYAVGHSWGSMTILRAASAHPERFEAVGLCNMPLEAGTFSTQLKFGFQHLMLGFRGFYTKQVGKAMFSEKHRISRPELPEYLDLTMRQLSAGEIRRTDRAVIMTVNSGMPFLNDFKVRAIALRGNEDYVGIPGGLELWEVEGKHTSPLEQPEAVLQLIEKLRGK